MVFKCCNKKIDFSKSQSFLPVTPRIEKGLSDEVDENDSTSMCLSTLDSHL